VLLDLAVPRDVDADVAAIDGVVLRDLDDLRGALQPGPEQLIEVERVREMIRAEIPRFTKWERTHHLAPLFEALQARGEDVRVREIRRAAARLGDLSMEQREAIDVMTRSLVAKLLNEAVASVKKKAGTAEGESLVRAVRELFDLPDDGR
jgi:glutamyl-tRNA reductase